MTLFIIGLGLNDEKDISLKGLEKIKKSKYVYLENYTSILNCPITSLEELYGKKIILADREMIEKTVEEEILTKAKEEDVSLLIVGDPMCATTHIDIYQRAIAMGVKVEIIHNASIINAVGITGLEVYKFGKVTSIPFHYQNVKAPYQVLINNMDKGMHTLFLLDLDPKTGKYLSIKEALTYLETLGLTTDTKVVGLARVGGNSTIKYGKVAKVKETDFGKPPYCIIIPAKMHFMEEEMLETYS